MLSFQSENENEFLLLPPKHLVFRMGVSEIFRPRKGVHKALGTKGLGAHTYAHARTHAHTRTQTRRHTHTRARAHTYIHRHT